MNAIIIVVDYLSKLDDFVTCHKSDDASDIASLFFKEIMRLGGVPRPIIFDLGTSNSYLIFGHIFKSL